MTNYVSLQDCCEIINGYAFKSEHYVPQGIRIIRIANVQRGYIADESPCFYSSDDPNASIRYKLFENDLLISLTGNVGRVGLLPHSLLPAALNQRVVCLRLRPESPVTKEFIFCCLNREEFENGCILNSTGVAQKNLSSKWLKAYKIPVPTPLQQQQICKSISAIDKFHNALNRELSHFDCLVKSRFSEMFGDCSDYASVSLADACEVFSDGDWIESKDQSDGGIRLIQTGNVGDGVYLDKASRAKYISFETFEGLRCTEVFPGDILISRLPDPVGRCCIVPDNLGRSITAVDCSIVRLASDWDSVFFRWFTLTDKYQAQVKTYLTGTTRQRISRKNLGKVLVPRVPPGDQRAFSSFANQVDKLRFDVQQQIEKLETLKKSLMQEYFG